MRPDLADVRLAEQVFAPHYAAPMDCRVARDAALRLTRDNASETMVELSAGDAFEVLELSGGKAWGVAPACGLVGYVDTDALAGG